MGLTSHDEEALRGAVRRLEFPSLTDRLNRTLGKPVNKVISMLPDKAQRQLGRAIETALRKALEWVLMTMDTSTSGRTSYDKTHKLAASSIGFAGGFLGGWAAIAEIPITTGLMLRTIADIAQSEGEDLHNPLARLACVEVLGLDTTHPGTAHVDVGSYYSIRRSMATLVRDAAQHLASATTVQTVREAAATVARQTGVDMATTVTTNLAMDESISPLVALLKAIETRYGLIISEEIAVQWLPVIGGVGGATINYLFMDHFQNMAHGHFTVRRLERQYGLYVVTTAYERLRQDLLGHLRPAHILA